LVAEIEQEVCAEDHVLDWFRARDDAAQLGQVGALELPQARENARSPFPLSWSTGETTELTLELADLQVGCLQEDRFAGISSSPQVSYPVTLKASTTDGALAGTYPVSLVVQRAPGGSGHQSVLQFTRQFADASGTGFHDVSIPSGTQRLSVVIDSQFTSANEGGHIVLNGLIDPPEPRAAHEQLRARLCRHERHRARARELGRSEVRELPLIRACRRR